MSYVGEGPPEWWLREHPEVTGVQSPPMRRAWVCQCGRDYLTVPLDGEEAQCPHYLPIVSAPGYSNAGNDSNEN